MTNKEKANRSFNFACKQANNCRHEKYCVSCYSCKELNTCDIHKRIETARKKM